MQGLDLSRLVTASGKTLTLRTAGQRVLLCLMINAVWVMLCNPANSAIETPASPLSLP